MYKQRKNQVSVKKIADFFDTEHEIIEEIKKEEEVIDVPDSLNDPSSTKTSICSLAVNA